MDRDPVGGKPDLFARFASGRGFGGLARFDSSTGKCDNTGIGAEIGRASGEDDPGRRAGSDDQEKDGAVAARERWGERWCRALAERGETFVEFDHNRNSTADRKFKRPFPRTPAYGPQSARYLPSTRHHVSWRTQKGL